MTILFRRKPKFHMVQFFGAVFASKEYPFKKIFIQIHGNTKFAA